MLTRRNALTGSAAALLAAPALAKVSGEDPPTNADGLYHQEWFHTSFMDLHEDLSEAAGSDKSLIVLVEQHGCPYCRELHKVNLARKEIRDFLQANYLVIQLNMWGDREVTDFDGEVLSEKKWCAKWYVSFTPTTIMFNKRDVGTADPRRAEAFRLPGYFKPFHYMTGLEFGAGETYRDQPFQRYVQERFERLEAQGIDPDLW